MKQTMITMAATVLLLAATAQTATAQRWKDAPQVHFGVRAGLSVTEPLDSWDGDNDDQALTAPSVGVAFDTKVAHIPFYVETGLYYMNRGCRYTATSYSNHHAAVSTYTADNHSVLIPALISYHAYVADKVAIQPFMGPYLAYGFDADDTDFGWRFGCGLNVKQMYVNLGFDLGLKDEYNYTSSFFVTLGWNFIGKK